MKVLACGLVAAVVTAAAQPARAESAAELQTKINRALASVSSFVVQTQFPDQDFASTLVYVKPDRSRASVAFSANTSDVVTIGRTIYRSRNGSAFERSTLPADVPSVTPAGIVKVVAVGPDVRDGGHTYGAFTAKVTLDKAYDLACTYDKATYRPRACTSPSVSQTYGGYDDPANVVDAPTNVVEVPSPAASVSAH